MAPRAESRRLLTVRQVAEALGVHQMTVRKWVTAGALPAKKVGPFGQIRIEEAEVEKIMKPFEPR